MYWIFLWRALKFKQIFTKNNGFMSISIQNFVVQSHLTHLFTLITELIIPYASMKHFVFHMNSIHTFSIFWWCCWPLDCRRARTFDVWRALGSRNFHEIDRTKFDDFLFLSKIQDPIWLDLWCVSIRLYPSLKNLRSM